jgi:hypothetical protein
MHQMAYNFQTRKICLSPNSVTNVDWDKTEICLAADVISERLKSYRVRYYYLFIFLLFTMRRVGHAA